MTYPYTDGIPGVTTPDASGNSIYNDGGPGGSSIYGNGGNAVAGPGGAGGSNTVDITGGNGTSTATNTTTATHAPSGLFGSGPATATNSGNVTSGTGAGGPASNNCLLYTSPSPRD